MKLVTFIPLSDKQGLPRFGALIDGARTAVDLTEAYAAMSDKPMVLFSEALLFLEGGEAALDMARSVLEFANRERPETACHDVDSVRLLAPVPRPSSLRDCIGFEKHVIQSTQTVLSWKSPALAKANALARRLRGRPLVGPPGVWYEMPLYYTSNPRTVVGPDADVKWPSYTETFDFELEYGIFIGRAGKNIRPEQAMDHVAGFTIFNDFSARDIQMREMAGRLGPAKGKNFDTGNVLGPWLVTPDEVGNPYNLDMRASVNGEQWSHGNSGDLYHRFEEVIAHISMDETLYPGDFIGSGTVGGGCGLELGRFLSPGDVVELSVDRLGTLRNRVVRNG
ncbi:MAG: fumarylacetoacetate hydrolase family protein [Desulfatibacillaceae bacterium]